jgi:hypothetical protein
VPLTDLLTQQLTDPFRIGLIVALIATMLRTREVTGTLLPLAAGAVFVAAIIPLTLQSGSPEPLWRLIGAGLVANVVLLAIGLGAWQLVQRVRG